jgi:hypothetical protein
MTAGSARTHRCVGAAGSVHDAPTQPRAGLVSVHRGPGWSSTARSTNPRGGGPVAPGLGLQSVPTPLPVHRGKERWKVSRFRPDAASRPAADASPVRQVASPFCPVCSHWPHAVRLSSSARWSTPTTYAAGGRRLMGSSPHLPVGTAGAEPPRLSPAARAGGSGFEISPAAPDRLSTLAAMAAHLVHALGPVSRRGPEPRASGRGRRAGYAASLATASGERTPVSSSDTSHSLRATSTSCAAFERPTSLGAPRPSMKPLGPAKLFPGMSATAA